MAESARTRRRRELGLLPAEENESTSSPSTGMSSRQSRMMDLGVIQDTRPKMTDKVNSGKLPSFNVEDSPLMKNARTANSQIIYDEPAGPPSPKPFLAQIQSDIYDNTIGPVQDKVMRFATSAIDTLTPGDARQTMKEAPSYQREIFGDALEPPQTTADKVADVAGSLYGATPAIMGSYATGGAAAAGALGRVAPNAPKLLANAVRGIGAGTAYGVGEEALQMAQGEEQSVGGRLLDVGKEAALFGAGDAAIGLIGKGVRAARGTAAKDLTQATQRQSLGSAVNNKRVKTERSLPVSEGPSYSGVNLLSRADEAIQTTESAPSMQQGWFTNLFGNQGLGASAFGSSKRIGNKPVSTEDAIVRKGIKNDTEGIKAEVAAQARSAYQNFVDALSPLKRINNATYETALDAARANNIANNIIGKDFVTTEGVRIGDGLETIFGKVGRGQDKQFVDYLILRDAEIRVPRGERVFDESLNMTPENIRKRIEMYDNRHPGFAAISKEWDAFTKNLRETYGVKEGLISEAQNAAMEASRPFYTPMRRQFTKSEKPGRQWLQNSSNSSFSGQKAPIKSVSPTGSVRDIVDPRKTMIEAVGAWTNAAMRNRAMQEIVKSIRENPEAMRGVAEIVPDTAEATQKSLKEINDVLASDGMEGLLERLNGEFDLIFKQGAQKGADDNIVRAMIDGQPVKIRVHDPEVVKALTSMSPQQAGLIVDLLSKFSNATKRGATGALAPMFAARSVTTDLVQSLIQAKNPAQHGVDLVHAIFSSVGDKLNIPGLRNLAQEFRRSGGEYSAALRGERQLNKSLGRLRRDPILSPQNIARQTGKVLTSPFKLGEAISDVSENVNRIAAYKGEMRRLGGERTPENVRRAITDGREITTNFSRKGAYGRELEALFPYQNAAIQGTYRVMRGFKENPVKTTAAVATLAILPKLFEYAQFHDDPDYQKLPARERMRHLIVNKNEDGTFTKIPIDPAYNSFGELTIESLRYMQDNDPQAFKGTLDALANAWTPPILTGALQGATQGTGIEGSVGGLLNSISPAPILGSTYNQSFTGAPIVPQRLEGRSDANQFDERTSSLAKWVGDKIGMAPLKVDYLLRAYGGDPGRIILPLTSDVGAGTTRNTLLKNFIVDPEFTNTLADDFYSAKDRLMNAKTDFDDVGDELPKWYSEDLYKLVNSRAKGSASAKLTDLNTAKRAINGNRNLSAEQKAQQLRDIQAEINDIYLEVNSKLEAAGVPMPGR